MNASERRGRLCVISSVERGHVGTLAHNSFRWTVAQIFNALPSTIRNCSNCDVLVFKRRLNNYLALLPDIPCTLILMVNWQDSRLSITPMLDSD